MIPARQFVTSSNPFADDVQARLALPFHKPWVKSFPLYTPVLQPMPSLEDMPRVKGYLFGGVIPFLRSDEDERRIQGYIADSARPKESIMERMSKDKDWNDLAGSLLNLVRR